ncbi:hypothetical protein BDR07DRAFT_1478176 [Suillus spraguei]|nr:hypothetical protein BDR07DRAFT_1478176 [Suillus spraguei]
MFTIRFTLRACFLAARDILPPTAWPAPVTASSNPIFPDAFEFAALAVSASSSAERTIPPLVTTPLLSRDALAPKPICYTPQQPSRSAARVLQVPAVQIVINPHERPAARAQEIPVAHVVINIKPAIQAHGESLGLSIAVDPRNDGCLMIF